MPNTTNTDSANKIFSRLGQETVFKGVMEFERSVKINGKFEGSINSTGFLYVEEGAEITADIKVRSIVINGTVHGNIEASEKAELRSTGKVIGNILTSRLKLEDGVVFEGKCEMIKEPEAINIFSATVPQLKRSVSGITED